MKRFYPNTAAFCLLIFFAFGCSAGGETGLPFPSPMPGAPELLSVEIVSETEVGFEFSTPVRRVSLSFDPSLGIASIDEGRAVRVRLEQSLEPGMRVAADIRAEDAHGNAFAERVFFEKKSAAPEAEAPFAPPEDEYSPAPPNEGGDSPAYPGEGPGRSPPPEMAINELRTEFNSNSPNRVEFVEFMALSAGNLYGISVNIYRSGGGRVPFTFEFPDREVGAGEFVVLYLRSPANKDFDSSPAAHNFWSDNARSVINYDSAIYARDRDGKVLCAVMLSSSPDPMSWDAANRRHLTDIAQFLFEQGAWKSAAGGAASPADAVAAPHVTSINITRSVSRDETARSSNTAADWYISAGATPGRPNNPNRH